MKVGDRVVATRKIRLFNGKVYPLGTMGIVTVTPPAKSVLHVLFEGAENPCAVSIKNIRTENTTPTLREKVRRFFA